MLERVWREKNPSILLQSVQLLSRVRLFATPWIAARQASLSITNSWSSLKLTSMESVMPSSHLILCHPLFLLPPIPPSIRVFSSESTLCMRWPKYWSFSLYCLWECNKSLWESIESLWRTVWRFLKKLKIELPYDAAIPLLGIYPEKNMVWKNTCIPMFISALFTIAKTWKQLNVHQQRNR